MQTSPATILVIEKHPLMRAAIVNAIMDEPDLTITAVAADGGDTLRIVLSLQPQIILFAIGNPGEDDLEAMRVLREHAPKATILALTSNEVPGQKQAALEYGAQAVLTKAAPRTELLQSLRKLRGRSIMDRSESKLAQEVSGSIS